MTLWVIIGLSWAALFLVCLIFALSLCRVSSHEDRETERLREAEVTPDLRRSAADPWSSASRERRVVTGAPVRKKPANK